MNGSRHDTPIQKFQALLRELFQFDCADLDFGIYRIMNHKRDMVERFITEKLPETVEAKLGKGALKWQADANAALDEARQRVHEVLGATAIDPDGGDIAPQFVETPVAKAYLEARARAGASRSREALEADVYNHLYTFFSRYYQDGDFISKRRYSRNQRYAIPYNGEEVYLHWANSDQYYVKTAEHFQSYQWKSPTGVTVQFRVEAANVDQNNVQGERRLFVPRGEDATWDGASQTVYLPFAYRPLSAAERRELGSTRQQEAIIAATVRDLPTRFEDADALAALTGERRRDAQGEPITHLEHHLRRYTRRNDSDFFIHKDLEGFLSRELDFYLKNEVLNLDSISAAGERAAEGWFQLLRLIKGIGRQIIDFLAQIEGFQRMLWEKRKFVTGTGYLVALAVVPAAFYREIAANDSQWAEWQDLFGVDATDRSASRLSSMRTLTLDTRHFPVDFVDRLIACFEDFDDMVDGLVCHGENWQALRLLEPVYRRSVKCIYIDPPYNTAASSILYKNDYKHSSWASLLENRLSASRDFLVDDGVLEMAINDAELKLALALLEQSFGGYEVQPIVVNHYPGSGSGRGNVSSTHEYQLMVVPRGKDVLVGAKRPGGVRKRSFRRSGQGENNFRHGRPNSFYAILVDPKTLAIKGMEEPVPVGVSDYPTGLNENGLKRIYPIGQDGAERVWSRHRSSATWLWQMGRLECTPTMAINHHIENEGRKVLTSAWLDKKFNAVVHGTNALADILGMSDAFPYPKSLYTVRAAVDCAVPEAESAVVLDYFAGSGTTAHAVIDLNRLDGGERKFVLVEVGEHFHSVLMPRIRKVIYAPEWENGRARREATDAETMRTPRIVKYIRLESYEDALDSIGFEKRAGELELERRIEGYLLKYMLKWETKGSETLLNPEKLASPFDYRLRIHSNGNTVDRPVDVAETFNYLLGLKVRTRRVYMDDGRRYLVFRGETRERPGRTTVVIWRDSAGWDVAELKRDKEFVAEQGMTEAADDVYVNGMSNIVGARPVEPIFKERMFAGVADGA